MNVVDGNVLLALHRSDHVHHDRAQRWWTSASSTGEQFTVPDLVWLAFCRLATSPKVTLTPVSFDEAWGFVEAVMAQPTYLTYVGHPRVLDVFSRLATASGSRGALLTDVMIAATALTYGGTVVSFDRDFRKFDGLRLLEPL